MSGAGSRDDKIKDLTQMLSKKRASLGVERKLKTSSGVTAPPKGGSSGKAGGKSKPSIKVSGQSGGAKSSGPSRKMRTSRPAKDFSKDPVFMQTKVDPMQDTDPQNLRDRVKEIVNETIAKENGRFTGTVEVGFEANRIVALDASEITVEEDIEERTIPNEQFDEVINYIASPDPKNKELAALTKGIPLQKILKAKELEADAVIKKVKVKLDGTIEYSLIATVDE